MPSDAEGATGAVPTALVGLRSHASFSSLGQPPRRRAGSADFSRARSVLYKVLDAHAARPPIRSRFALRSLQRAPATKVVASIDGDGEDAEPEELGIQNCNGRCPRRSRQQLRDITEDYTLWANVMFVICSIGYVYADYSRGYLEDHVNFSNYLYIVIAALFVSDSVLYLFSWQGSVPAPDAITMWAEYLNVAASIGYLIQAAFYQYEATPIMALAVLWWEAALVMIFLVDALCYLYAWYITTVDVRATRGCTVRDVEMWANVFNILPSLVYTASSIGGLWYHYTRVQHSGHGSDLLLASGSVNDLAALRFMSRIYVWGDLLYLIDSVIYMFVWVRDYRHYLRWEKRQKVAAKLLADLKHPQGAVEWTAERHQFALDLTFRLQHDLLQALGSHVDAGNGAAHADASPGRPRRAASYAQAAGRASRKLSQALQDALETDAAGVTPGAGMPASSLQRSASMALSINSPSVIVAADGRQRDTLDAPGDDARVPLLSANALDPPPPRSRQLSNDSKQSHAHAPAHAANIVDEHSADGADEDDDDDGPGLGIDDTKSGYQVLCGVFAIWHCVSPVLCVACRCANRAGYRALDEDEPSGPQPSARPSARPSHEFGLHHERALNGVADRSADLNIALPTPAFAHPPTAHAVAHSPPQHRHRNANTGPSTPVERQRIPRYFSDTAIAILRQEEHALNGMQA